MNIEKLKETRTNLKNGEYDGVDIMQAWLAIDRLIIELKKQLTPSKSEIGDFAKAISKQAVDDYKASLVPAAYFLRESYDGTDEYNQTDPTFNKAMPLYELGETK